MSAQQSISEIDKYLDENVGHAYKTMTPLPQHWARLSKIGEEFGEAIDAFIGITGQNPRKGIYSSMEELEKELFDTAATALLAREHFFKDEETWTRFINHLVYLRKRVNA